MEHFPQWTYILAGTRGEGTLRSFPIPAANYKCRRAGLRPPRFDDDRLAHCDKPVRVPPGPQFALARGPTRATVRFGSRADKARFHSDGLGTNSSEGLGPTPSPQPKPSKQQTDKARGPPKSLRRRRGRKFGEARGGAEASSVQDPNCFWGGLNPRVFFGQQAGKTQRTGKGKPNVTWDLGVSEQPVREGVVRSEASLRPGIEQGGATRGPHSTNVLISFSDNSSLVVHGERTCREVQEWPLSSWDLGCTGGRMVMVMVMVMVM
eukprot:9480230-Pyramimonas_sp.AAC.1